MGKSFIVRTLRLFLFCLMLVCGKSYSQDSGVLLLSPSPPPDEKELDASIEMEVEGKFSPSQRLSLTSHFKGRLENLSVTRGQIVPSGYPLMTIVEDQLFADLDQKSEELASAEKGVEATQGELSRLSAMAESEDSMEESSNTEEDELLNDEDLVPEPIPTFERLAQNVNFTPVDAGGIWPEIEGDVIANAQDPQDAGGVWPSYGVRERVDGSPPSGERETIQSEGISPTVSGVDAVAISDNVAGETPEELKEEVPEATNSPDQQLISFLENRLSLEEAKVDRIQAEIALLEKEISSRVLLAPWEGLVQQVSVSDGDTIEEGTQLVEISRVDPIEFCFYVSKDKVSFLKMGMEVQGRVASGELQEFSGKISFIGPELNEDQSVEVRAEVENPNRVLKLGTEAKAKIRYRDVLSSY